MIIKKKHLKNITKLQKRILRELRLQIITQYDSRAIVDDWSKRMSAYAEKFYAERTEKEILEKYMKELEAKNEQPS